MKIKVFGAWLLKAFLSGILAFVVVNLFSLFWYNVPFRIASKTGSTDYAWEQGALQSHLTEGFGFGRIDQNGYYNAASLAANAKPDILVVGSSHMEAFQMFQDETLTYILDAKLDELGLDAYSIGIAGNTFLICVKNMQNALQTLQPKYIVIETDTLSFSNTSIQQAIDGSMENVGNFGSFAILTRLPYLRLLYRQWNNIAIEADVEETNGNINNDNEEAAGSASTEQNAGKNKHSPLDSLMKKIDEICTENSAIPIIFYHPHLNINVDGTATAITDQAVFEQFSTACSDNNILFVDLTEVFLSHYYSEHILPHGFFNNQIGIGHLNTDGHRIAAETLSEVITVLETGGDSQ